MTIIQEIERYLIYMQKIISYVGAKMYYPKHLLVIKDKSFNIGNNFVIDEDLDRIYQEMTFDVPYYSEGSWTLKDINYHDRVQLYFKFFNTPQERDAASIEDLDLVFDGYIEDRPISENKSEGIQWKSLKCKSTFGLAFERTTLTKFFEANIQTILQKGIEEVHLSEFIPSLYFSNDLSENLILKVDSTNKFGEVCNTIKTKYAINIFQAGNGSLYIQTPLFFYNGAINVYEYDLRDTIFDIDYGNISTRINAVCVLGTNAVGAAYDPISYQLMLGVPENELQNNITPNPIYLYPRFIERKDLFSTEDCQQVARNILVDSAKNYTINFSTMFDTKQKLGDMFLIKGSEIIPETQKWIIKKRNITINKNNITCNITGYSNGIIDFPDNILLDASGLLDTDILNVSDKVENQLTLG